MKSMAQATLQQILSQLPSLEPDELRQLSQAVLEQLSPQEEARKREAFHQALLSAGLIRQINRPRRGIEGQRQLIEVQGKPVSETIIEERR